MNRCGDHWVLPDLHCALRSGHGPARAGIAFGWKKVFRWVVLDNGAHVSAFHPVGIRYLAEQRAKR